MSTFKSSGNSRKSSRNGRSSKYSHFIDEKKAEAEKSHINTLPKGTWLFVYVTESANA